MIIGNGQIAQCFADSDRPDLVIFASGVPDSTCIEDREFERERCLLLDTVKHSEARCFVYFSSCALSAPNYPKSPYYQHKKNMEEVVMKNSDNFFIFRLPQLFGKLKKHRTLINFFHEAIISGTHFYVYESAYRYVIEIEDLRELVLAYIDLGDRNTIIDVGNPSQYRVIDLVRILESATGIEGNYTILPKEDTYTLDLRKIETFVKENKLDIEFGESYFRRKLLQKLAEFSVREE